MYWDILNLLENIIFCNEFVAVLIISEAFQMEMSFVIPYQLEHLTSILSKKFTNVWKLYEFQNESTFLQKLYCV
jgi:hypothetical protein